MSAVCVSFILLSLPIHLRSIKIMQSHWSISSFYSSKWIAYFGRVFLQNQIFSRVFNLNVHVSQCKQKKSARVEGIRCELQFLSFYLFYLDCLTKLKSYWYNVIFFYANSHMAFKIKASRRTHTTHTHTRAIEPSATYTCCDMIWHHIAFRTCLICQHMYRFCFTIRNNVSHFVKGIEGNTD